MTLLPYNRHIFPWLLYKRHITGIVELFNGRDITNIA